MQKKLEYNESIVAKIFFEMANIAAALFPNVVAQ